MYITRTVISTLKKNAIAYKKIDVMYVHMCTRTGEKLLYTCPNTQIL